MQSFEEYLAAKGIETQATDNSAQTQPNTPDYNIQGGSYLVDADTYALPTGEKVRLQGINAREVPGFNQEEGTFKAGQYGGEQQQQIVNKIIQDKGFNKPLYDPKVKDATGTRYMGDLVNDKGEKLTDYLLSHGLVSTTQYTTAEQSNLVDIGRLDRVVRKQNDAADRFDKALKGEMKYSDAGDLYYDLLTAEMSRIPLMAKPFATSAKLYGMNPEEYAGAGYVRGSEDEMGYAKSNWKTGLKSGLEQMNQGFFGAANLISNQINFEPGIEWSNAKNLQSKNVIEDLPFLKDAEAFDSKTGKWKLDGFGKLFNYTIATAAQSAPQMVATIAATLASPLTYGASLSIPAAIYTGQIWNDQPEGQKSATWALSMGITSAVFDKLGIEGVIGTIGSRTTRQMAIDQLVKKGMTKEAAEQQIINETKKVTTQLMDVVKAGGMGAASESITETGQQFAQYLGANLGQLKDTNELKNQLVNAAFGGAVLGGGMSGAGRAVSNAFAANGMTAKGSDLDFREQQRLENGYVPSTHEIIEQALNAPEIPVLARQAEFERSKRETAGLVGSIKNWYHDKGLSSLVGKFSDSIIGDRGYRGKFSAALATILGSNNAVNGGDLMSAQELTAGGILSNMGNIKEIQDLFSGKRLTDISTILFRKDVIDYMQKLADFKKNMGDADMKAAAANIDSSILGPDVLSMKNGIIEVANRIDNTVQSYNRKTNSNKLFSDVVSSRPLNKSFISRNRDSFITDIKNVLGISTKEAQDMYTSLMNNENILTAEDSLEDLLGENPGKGNKDVMLKNLHEANKSGVLNKYFTGNIFDNVDALAHHGGVLHVNKTLIGKDGTNLAALLAAAVREKEITEQEASFMAKEIEDFLAMREGKYKQIKNPLVNGVIDTITFFSTLASLPLATISSIPEAAQVMRGLNTPQALKAYKRLLTNTAEEMAAVFKEIGSREKNVGMKSRQLLSNLGYATGDQNVAARYDIHSGYFQDWTNGFFKLIGLQGYTNATRYARLAIGADAIHSWLNTLQNADFNKLTQAEQDAYEHLVRVGVDPFVMNDPNVDVETYKQMMDRGTYNFINEAVVHPTTLNRPKFYSDPHLRIFTMFQGYISAFTANILPRIYKDLAKKGSADQRNAAATVATMIALTMLAMVIKDMVKYGQTPPEWLKGDDAKLAQRFIGATGLTGTGERVINFVNPLVDKKATNPAEKLYNILEGESPTLSFGAKVASAANAVLSDTGSKPIKKVAGVAPVIGPINQLGDYLQNEFGGK